MPQHLWMLRDVIASTDLWLFFTAMLACGVFSGVVLERYRSMAKRRRWKQDNRWRWQRETTDVRTLDTAGAANSILPASRIADAADQLRIVMGATFFVQPLLNEKETRVYRELDRSVAALNPEWRVMAQVSLGEILRSRQSQAYACINSKRIDLLIVDDKCRPRHALEYQGSGHYRGTAAARDAVKKEALRRAGIGYHEIVAGQTKPFELRKLVERLVERPAIEDSRTSAVEAKAS